MMKKILGIGSILLIGVLVLGAIAIWATPEAAEAAYGGRQGGRGSERQSTEAVGEQQRVQEQDAEDCDGDGVGYDQRTENGEEAGYGQGQGGPEGAVGQQGGRGAGQGQQGAGRGQQAEGWNGQSAGRAEPVVPGDYDEDLSESEVEALLMALDDEYKAWSVYDQVIADLGQARPFNNIQRAEEKHIAALVNLFDAYGLEVPVNPYPGEVPSYDSLTAACEAGVQAEVDNADLYDQLFSMVDNPEIVQVFTSLQQASEMQHLPAFERCAD